MQEYNSSTGDIVSPLGQSKDGKLKNGFLEIGDVSIDQIANQNQIMPRQIRTGSTRGDQQVKGVYTVVDNNNVVRVVMGYVKGGF